MTKNKLGTAAVIGILSSQAFGSANVPNEATGVTYEYRNGMTARLKCTSSDALEKNSCFLEIRDRARKIVLDIDHEALGYAWRDLTMNFVTFGNPFKPIFYVQLGVSCEDKDIALVKSNRDLDCSIFFKFENNRLVAKYIDVMAFSANGEIISESRKISVKKLHK